MASFRYQVVYKKLVRSLRKFNVNKFVASGFINNTDEPQKFMKHLQEHLADYLGAELGITKLNMTTMTIKMGALIYPNTAKKFYAGDAKAE
jgi:hypothetical protein